MKKHLLSTSAIALGVAIAAPAAAQEWDVSFGGFMSQRVVYIDRYGSGYTGGANDGDGVDISSSTEIIFTPSITLDNGLTFGVNVQLEGENVGGQIDETYMTISSDTLGQILIGSENSAGYKSMVAAPGVTTMYINSNSLYTLMPISNVYGAQFLQAGGSSFTEVAANNDVQRLTYFTPSFNGLTVGVSYAPTGSANATNGFGADRSSVTSDIFDIGVNYSQTFGSTSVVLAARYGIGNAPTSLDVATPGANNIFDGLPADGGDDVDATFANPSDPETWGVGAQVSFADFTVGGSYGENDAGTPNGAGDSTGWSFGVTYDIAGPWALEALTYQGEWKDGNANKGEYNTYRIGASRDLGPGVSWDIFAVQADVDNGLAGVANRDVNATMIGTGINVSF